VTAATDRRARRSRLEMLSDGRRQRLLGRSADLARTAREGGAEIVKEVKLYLLNYLAGPLEPPCGIDIKWLTSHTVPVRRRVSSMSTAR